MRDTGFPREDAFPQRQYIFGAAMGTAFGIFRGITLAMTYHSDPLGWEKLGWVQGNTTAGSCRDTRRGTEVRGHEGEVL